MPPSPDATLPPLSTLLRNNSCASSGCSSPPASPITPREGPTSYFDMDAKRRAAPPAPLTALPSLTSSIPLVRKPSDERRNISALLNEREPRRQEYDHPSHAPPPGSSQGPHHPPPPPHHRPPSSHSQHHHAPLPSHHLHHSHHPPTHVPPPHEHHASHDPHHPYPHHHPGTAARGSIPHPPISAAPLMPSSAPLVQPRGYFSPPPSRQSYGYRPPSAPHPDAYGRPDMGRRHTYHPAALYEYPMYEMGMPIGYHPAFIGVPFDSGMGARAPISRTTKACDACRSRKVRCDAGGLPGSTGTCSRCRESGRICVYTATQKKRGPTPGRPARSQSSSNVNVGRRDSLDGANAPPLGDRRQTWSASGRPPSSAGGPSRSSVGYPPHSAGHGPSAPWPYPHGYDDRDVRHHPYRPPSGPRTAPLVERERPSVSGREPYQGPPPPPHAASHPAHPAGPAYHPHEPRQPPIFDANYSLQPHPSSAWPQGSRRDYGYAPEYSRRSVSPPPAIRLAPLRRE